MKNMMNIAVLALTALCCLSWGMQSASAADARRAAKVRLVWEPVADAVCYELVITRGKSDREQAVALRRTTIYANGCELETSLLPDSGEKLYWMVRGLNFSRQPVSAFSKLRPLAQAEFDPDKPLLTGSPETLPYAKLYPVYSWIPVVEAKEYELQVFRGDSPGVEAEAVLLKTARIAGADQFDYYDTDAYVAAGTYWWRVRAKDALQRPLGGWSAAKSFTVARGGVRVAAFGDSITHGGGAVSAPPSYPLYDWENYADVPILNMGFSGDVVERMAERFARDVLPFSPRILVVMGGINNIRQGDSAAQVIRGLNQIKYKCLFNGITPVFATVLPVNPTAMRRVSGLIAASGWMNEQEKVNAWIRRQTHFVDVALPLTESDGTLRSDLSTDGLHPDARGKRLIGEAIGAYLKEKFPDLPAKAN